MINVNYRRVLMDVGHETDARPTTGLLENSLDSGGAIWTITTEQYIFGSTDPEQRVALKGNNPEEINQWLMVINPKGE